MKRQMYKSIRSLLVLLLVAPGMAWAQKQDAPAPCSSNIQVSLDLSDVMTLANVASLAELKKIPDLSELSELKEIGKHFSQTGPAGEVVTAYDSEKRKAIDKTFKVTKSDVLSIQNKFGKVHVNTWNKNEIKVRVDIIARASSDTKAQEILDKISVQENRQSSMISFKTQMEPMKITGKGDKSFEINYTVYMPEDNAIAVKNSFGDVYLANLKGKADISVKYGTLKTDRLSNNSNSVSLAYSSGNCGYINGGNINVSYSDMNVGGANGLQGSSKFSDFKIGDLGQELNLELKYGSFKVDRVSKDIRKIMLESGFSPILLNFADNSAFNFDVNVQFADFKVDKSLVNVTSLEKGYTSAEYKGKFGGASPKGVISINSKYGDVKFTK
ncbi:hypothetical protein ACSX1A_19850 [Pontibacter sp. MBLB2868]|uniref:hypothetical protein n=1 Tax=Pontibacter sp. MBLB2868 TaxID=3451555 RepID=UPI003F753027